MSLIENLRSELMGGGCNAQDTPQVPLLTVLHAPRTYIANHLIIPKHRTPKHRCAALCMAPSLTRHSQVQPQPFKIALCQPDAPPRPTVASSLQALSTFAEQAAAQSADLLLLPELFLGGYLCDNVAARAVARGGRELEEVASIARRYHVAIVLGYCEVEGGEFYNSALVVDAVGRVVANYRKTHLFGEAENGAFS